jgi:hypothetical protein
MVKTGLAGQNPRVAHPSRYARERKIREIPTPLSPFSELQRQTSLPGHAQRR